MKKMGKVYLVGAGPGDPGLITWRGIELLAAADCVLYDSLANHELLSHCRAGCEKIFVGKKAGKHYVRQEDTIEILIEKAKSGVDVVRLKGGDPLVFGRGSEEAAELLKENIEFEIIPGITAATGATAYAGIPLTHRNMVTQCVMVTAHEAPDKQESQVDWQCLAQMKHTTIVIYMGARKLSDIAKRLMFYGMSPDKPAASIENGTLPYQKIVESTISELPEKVAEAGLQPPMLTVIGPTVGLREQIDWFAERPLAGKSVIVTRARDQAQSLYEKLSWLGAEPVPFPVIRTSLSDPGKDARELMHNKYDWIVFSSENGVRYFFEYLRNAGLDARAFGKARIAAIGSGTARRLDSLGIIADFVPSSFTSKVLIGELTEKYDIANNKILRVKGYFKNDPLTDGLRENGAEVTTCAVYDLESDSPDEYIIENVAANGADFALFTSMSTVDNFFRAMGEEAAAEVLRGCTPIAIGPVTATALDRHGISEYETAEKHNIDGLVDVLLKIC
jgi:uroporphyrinogen III methyltransferase/synthase